MDYPPLTPLRNSPAATRRTEHAVAVLGNDVVTRILGFATYLLGWPQAEVAKAYGFSVPGLKSLVQQVIQKGVSRFLDQRRKDAYPLPQPQDVVPPAPLPAVSVDESEGWLRVNLNACQLQIPVQDTLARKVLAMLLVDSGVMTQKAAAEVMGTQPLAVTKNYQAYRAQGAQGLVDKRTGQAQDYRFQPEVKGELVYGYSMQVLQGRKPSSGSLAEYLTEVFGTPYSRRSVSHHLSRLGLSLVGPRLQQDIQATVNEREPKKGL